MFKAALTSGQQGAAQVKKAREKREKSAESLAPAARPASAIAPEPKSESAPAPNLAPNDPWLICGLGNPGDRYHNTRHNVGHAVVDLLATRGGESWKRHQSGTLTAKIRLGVAAGGAPGPAVILAKSLEYMNVSGLSLANLAKYAKIDPAHILVVHDELDLPEHALRLKRGGGEGGHNGLKSLSVALNTRDYARLRMGIGRPPGRMDPAAFVLAKIGAKIAADWEVTYQLAADAVEAVVTRGFTAAQQDLHSKSGVK